MTSNIDPIRDAMFLISYTLLVFSVYASIVLVKQRDNVKDLSALSYARVPAQSVYVITIILWLLACSFNVPSHIYVIRKFAGIEG